MKKLILLICLLALSLVGCGRLESAGEVRLDSTFQRLSFEEIFNYYYDSAPEVYGQLQFVKKAADKNFQDVAVIAVMGKSDGSIGVMDYELKMINENGFPVCPSATGRLTAGATSVTESCVSQVISKTVTVSLKVTLVEGAKRRDFNFERKY